MKSYKSLVKDAEAASFDIDETYEQLRNENIPAFKELDQWLCEGGRLPEPWVRRAGMGTRDAMNILKKNQPLMIEWGEYYAVKIAIRKLTVHSREVWDEMIRDKIITGEGKAHWLGTVFRELRDAGVLVKTMHMYKYSDEVRGIHERSINLWTLNADADLTPYRVAPKTKP